MITALILSAGPLERSIAGLEVVVHQARITNALEHLEARFDAIAKVKTDHFFFLDDDDALPDDYQRVLDLCVAADADLAYTDEMVVHPGQTAILRARAPYRQSAHLRNPQLIHHLALCRTAAAKRAVARLPRGPFYPEMLLYWQMAKTGAIYVPEPGYVWQRRADGLSANPHIVMSQVRTQLWCKKDAAR